MSASQLSPDNAQCPCGSEWFELRDYEHGPAVVALTETGIIHAYSGAVHCVECDRRWFPFSRPLTLTRQQRKTRNLLSVASQQDIDGLKYLRPAESFRPGEDESDQ